jgi:hypothetical protein
LNFLGKFVEGVEELVLLVALAHAPISRVEFVNEGLVDVVDHGVQSDDSVLTDFTEKNFRVILALVVDTLAGAGATHKVNTLAAQFFFFAISDVELGLVGTLNVFNLASLINSVRHLVVDEEMSGASALHPRVEERFVLVSKNSNRFRFMTAKCIVD